MKKVKSSSSNIVLIGGGGHCISCIEVLKHSKQYTILGILDKFSDLNKVSDYDYLGDDSRLEDLRNECENALICIGQIKDPGPRKRIFEKLKELDYILPTILSPHSYISENNQIGEGSIIMNNCFINSHVQIGVNCIINNRSHLEHEVIIGDNCHISTSSVINGNVTVGDNVFIGSNSTIGNGVNIGDHCVIGAGLFVSKDIENGTVLKK